MLQRVLALLLQRLLGKFVSFDSSMLRLSLWQGDLEFKDLELRLSYGDGSIGKLSVKIPWRALWTQPVVIRASHIRILLHQSPKSTEANLNGLSSSVGGSEDDPADLNELEGSTDRTYLSRLVSHIISNVQIELTDVQVRYDCMPDSTAKRPGSASLEVQAMRLINANAEWEVTYTPQSNSIMESRKLLTTEGISAYVEYSDPENASRRSRRYLLHDWHTSAKATLCYHSANASFPDVELEINVGRSPPSPESDNCSYCHQTASALVEKALTTAQHQPTIHLGAEHIDVFYAILMEVKAPYEEFERFAELTQKQSSRPEGFLMVLSYARQWLLADCLDGIATDSTTLAGSDDDDDDDEFEDAITPPTLTLRMAMVEGFMLVMASRHFETDPSHRLWVWTLGYLSSSVKQSCVDDEVHVRIGACIFEEVGSELSDSYFIMNLGEPNDEDSAKTTAHFSCSVPAYQSRLVGFQPSMTVRVYGNLDLKLKDESLVRLMTLFSPVYHWWNQWSRLHPSKIVMIDEMRIAPISKMTIDIPRVSMMFAAHQQLCLGVSLEEVKAETIETDDTRVSTQFQLVNVRIFSGNPTDLMVEGAVQAEVESSIHEIAKMKLISTTKSSHSRLGWQQELYLCFHDDNMPRHADQEEAMYRYSIVFPEVSLDIRLEELEAVSWVIGKWSFFLPATSEAHDTSHQFTNATQSICRTKLTLSVPSIMCTVSCKSEGSISHSFTLAAETVGVTTVMCTKADQIRAQMGSFSIRDGSRVLLQATGGSRQKAPALSFSSVTRGGNVEGIDSIDTKVALYQLESFLYLESIAILIQWAAACANALDLGFVLATSLGYDFDQFKDNLAYVKAHFFARSEAKLKSKPSNIEVTVGRSVRVVVLHRESNSKLMSSSDGPVELVGLECSGLAVSAASGTDWKLKGTVKNLQVTDLTFPREMPKGMQNMPNRYFISSNQMVGNDGAEDTSIRNSVDFTVTFPEGGAPIVRIRLDSVNAVYLHRVYKQIHHYISDHILTANFSPSTPTAEEMRTLMLKFEVDKSELPISVEEIVRMYRETTENVVQSSPLNMRSDIAMTKYELVANDIMFSLPRSSFSSDSIVLRSTNARFWSSSVDPEESDFLQSGLLDFDPRGSAWMAADPNHSKALQTRRVELRNLRRLVKNQRSRMLSNRSQLFVDLKNATQQAQNYLHEGFEALPAAEDAVKIIHAKIIALEQELEQLNHHLREVDEAIESTKDETETSVGGGRDSMFAFASSPMVRDGSAYVETDSMILRIKGQVMGMSQHLIAPIFGADDAEFHDARPTTERTSTAEQDMSSSTMSLFEFELVDMSGMTSHSHSPLFHHALLTGRIDSLSESLPTGSVGSYLSLDLSMNELSVGAREDQYSTLLAVIFENFKEVSSVVDEDTYPLCKSCNGHHYADQLCNSVWLKIPVRVADAALRISNDEHAIADILMEQLELTFTLRTDDSLEISASSSSLSAVDIRPTRSDAAIDILRPIGGEGLQVEYNQWGNWTESRYSIMLNNTSCLLVYPIISEAVEFFVRPVNLPGAFFDFGVGFMCESPPEWTKMDITFDSRGCSFAMLEDFSKRDSNALVILSSMELGYTTTQSSQRVVDLRKCHVSLDQRGIFFSQLPDLQIDVSFPLANPFVLVFDHLVEGTARLSRRNSFVLAPVEARFSVQDGLLFVSIVENYVKSLGSGESSTVNSDRSQQSDQQAWNGEQSSSADWLASDSRQSNLGKAVLNNGVAMQPAYAMDKLLGDVGELRFVLVNNSLGIPVADFQLSEIVCEYIQDEEYSVVIGAILALNYFNNSIYRWEPLIEPFVAQVRVQRNLEENSRLEVFANLPNTVNLNLTPAMAPLLSSETLKQADFVTSGSKSTAPFWIVNKTGADLKFSFRRGRGNVIQQVVPNEVKVAVDCREQGDMRSFDSASADRFLQPSDRNGLTVNHTLSVWLNENKWVSANPVVVDVVGHISVPLREANGGATYGADDSSINEEEQSPPILVAEISIQPDGSKMISLHSQVVLQNRTSIPLMVWAFSPREGGVVREWIIDREQICHVPIDLIHPQSKISMRPSPYVQYAPLATSLEELGDEVQASKAKSTKRFVRSGQCVCNFEAFVSLDDVKKIQEKIAQLPSYSSSPLTGYVVQDLPTWKCTYDVEAYFLMRATFAGNDDMKGLDGGDDERLSALDEGEGEEANAKVEQDFMNVFSDTRGQRRRIAHPLSEVNHELEEARTANQRRGLYEATNSSLYHLSISPFVTLHNRLAAPVAYRLLNQSLQLIGEGVLAIGSVLPLFQMDPTAPLFVSFRLENYNWSVPKLIVNPKHPSYSLPYKDVVETLDLFGRVFSRGVPGQQDDVPNLQLQVKLSGRDVIVFCSVWIVNHSGLDLEYCNSTSTSSRRLESVLRYVHKRRSAEADQSTEFSTRTMSFSDDFSRDLTLTRLQKMKAASNPVALVVVVQEAKELYNSQYFGAQSPYVRASLYIVKNSQDRFLEKPEMIVFCSGTTKPSPSGGISPTWDTKLQNTLLLRLPEDPIRHEKARVILEVRNVRYGMDTCLGVTAIKLETILNSRDHAAGFNWYKLLKRKSSKDKKQSASSNGSTNVHRGDLRLSFAVGTKQELKSEFDTLVETPESQRSTSSNPYGRSSFPDEENGDNDLDEAFSLADGSGGFVPSSGAIRSMQRLQTPSNMPYLSSAALSGGASGDHIFGPPSQRARQVFNLSEVESTRSQMDIISIDPTSTRAGMGRLLNGSPPKSSMGGSKIFPIQVYLPQNRFAFVVIHVSSSSTMTEIFELVCSACGFHGVLDIEDFDFYELLLPRFVSLRSAGRPEGERWYGPRLPMDSRIEKRGRKHGLHLCHKLAMSTIRLYDETSTASSHHMTPRSLLTTSQKINPAQKRPVAWGEVLPYGTGGRNWDVLRVRTHTSPWSEVIRLNRNAMGNAGVAQVITLKNEALEQAETSDLRKGSQEIALWSTFGSGRFSETIIATIVPRYILINRTNDTIKYRQVNVPHTYQLKPNDLVPFHWPSSSKDKLLEVTMLHGFMWSGSFRIYSLGTTYLKLRDSDNPSKIYILQCQIEMVGGSIALIFREESRRFPPYRIDNMTSFRIQYKQSYWGSENDYDELLPRSSCPYSWDLLTGNEKPASNSVSEPTFASHSSSSLRALQVRFMRVTSSTGEGPADKAAVESREYNLDEMTSHRRIQLQRSLPSQLFVQPDHKGFLMKKDNMLKWNKRYFRLYEHMLYYFAGEKDQELLGVIDLRSGNDASGAGGVAIFEKAAETSTAKSGGFMNGFVSSISGTIFGTSSRQTEQTNDGAISDDDDDDDERAGDLIQIAVLMTASSTLCETSERFAEKLADTGDPKNIALSRKGFFVNGHDVVDFLVLERHVSSETEALATASELVQMKALQPVVIGNDHKATTPRFQYSKIAWYSVNSVMLANDSDSMDSSEDTPQNALTTPSTSRSTKAPTTKPKAVPRSNQFSIITTTKFYDLKATTAKESALWIRKLRRAARGNARDTSDRSQRDQSGVIVQNAKTYVHVRIRADGPTKVLELYEGGEEEAEERDAKHELSSLASQSSGSPTASETSTNAFDSIANGLTVHLRIDSFGISCINEIPTELVYIFFGGISVHYSRANAKMRLKFTLDDIQIDNQTTDATFVKLLCPRMEGDDESGEKKTRASSGEDPSTIADEFSEVIGDESSTRSTGLIANANLFSCADCKYRQANIASMHFCCTWSNEQGTTDYFEHCSFWMYPVIMQLDEELLVSARAFIEAMTRSWGKQRASNHAGEIRLKSIPIEIMAEAIGEFRENTEADDLNPLSSLVMSTASSSVEVRKVYFALLHIHPIEMDITYRSDVFQGTTTLRLREAAASFKANVNRKVDDPRRTASMPNSASAISIFEFDNGGGGSNGVEDGDNSSTWAIPSLAMHIPDLDNAPVRLSALMIEHAFGTSGDLTRRVSKYYTRQMWKQLHKILGSFDFLGNPVGFLDHIGTGVRDFVYEPLEGLKVGGKGFSRGLAKGTASLVSNTLDGTFDAASKISGTFGQGLANLSLDDHYQQIRARARRHHVRGIRDGLMQGSKELSLGVYEGVAGLVMNPMRGAQTNGAIGFVKGTITGIIGLPVKPVAGIFDFASRASQGVRNRSRKYGKSMRRVRRPRVFGRYNELKCYKEADTIAYDLLKKTGGNKLSGEKIVFYNEVMQSIAGSELTKEARERRKNDTLRERSASFKRSLQEHEDMGGVGRDGRRKLLYEATFHQKKLGLELETDFYCENVTIKAFEEQTRHNVTIETPLGEGQDVLQEGDVLVRIGGVDVRGIGFHETLAMLRGTTRPIRLQFESAEESFATPAGSTRSQATPKPNALALAEEDSRLRVQLTHWIIVTEERAMYINVGSLSHPVVEWMTPLRYVYRVEWVRGLKICLHLSVGVDSLPTGPRLRPSLKALEGHERDMNVFLDVMWLSFGSTTAEEQELWPSDTSLNGYLLKKGGFSTVKRWFVLSRNCLYYFSNKKELRGIIPLGCVRLQADAGETYSIRITNERANEPLVTLQMDNGQVIERAQSEIVLIAPNAQDFEMWQSSLAHAAGRGLRHSRGTRFFVSNDSSRLEIGCKDTPDFVVAPLVEALRRAVEVFNTKLTAS